MKETIVAKNYVKVVYQRHFSLCKCMDQQQSMFAYKRLGQLDKIEAIQNEGRSGHYLNFLLCKNPGKPGRLQ